MINLVKEDYKEYLMINKSSLPDGLYESLKCNDRMPIFFFNLAKELTDVDRKFRLDRLKIKDIVYSFAGQFVFLVKRMAEEKYMTLAEKQRLVKDFDSKKIISDEVATAYKENLEKDGVIINNDQC